MPISAAKTRDAARDHNHQYDRYASHNKQELKVDLAVATGKPGLAFTAYI